MKKVPVILGALVVIIVVVAIVIAPRTPFPSPSESSSGSDSAKSIESLRVGLAGLGDINTLDPARAGTAAPIIVVWHLYERLVDVAPDGSIKPMIASSWSHDEELKEWQFRIRTDAYFHTSSDEPSARTVSPADVRASIERALRIPGLGQTLLGDLLVGSEPFIAGESDHISGIEVSGDRVTFKLVRPFAFLPERLAASFFSVLPQGTADDPAEPPLGSGPFRLVDWDKVAKKVELQRSEAYTGKRSPDCPKRLVFYAFEQEAAGIEEVKAGTLDWLEATSSAWPLARSLAGQGSLHIATPPQTVIRLVALNMTRNPFADDARIGRLLNYATDRSALVEALGGGKEIGSPIPSGVLAKPELTYHFEPARAEELAAQLPQAALNLEMIVQPGQEPRLIAELLRQQWEKFGIHVTLKQGLADFFPRVVAGNYQMALGYFGPFVPSAEQYLWPYRKDAQPAPNVMRYASETFESAFAAFSSAPPGPVAAKALDDALHTLYDRPPAVWLVRAPRVVVTSGEMTVPRMASVPLFHLLSVEGQ
ncbi:MAG: ABC transporter substrate-binding protein [Planctomycetes bacterium]|nr:ABC transporter substrate-binding protein [Planctomycetota bacterium]